MASFDMRPAKGTLFYELLRLGLVFDHSDDGKAQTWMDYASQLRADVTGADATTITLTDTMTRLTQDVTLDQLKTFDSIVTWKSDCPVTPETPAETPAEATGEPTA